MDLLAKKELAMFSSAVRESTLKRLFLVPSDFENWRVAPGKMSIAELIQHLIDCDEWMMKKVKDKNFSSRAPDSASAHVGNRDDYLKLIDVLRATGVRRRIMIEEIPAGRFSDVIEDKRFVGEVTVWWLIARGNLDHEIHHRGQLSAYLQMMESGN